MDDLREGCDRKPKRIRRETKEGKGFFCQT